jgi:hypothetical protein
MHIARLFAIGMVAMALAGCATLGPIQQVATATVPASVVIPAANAFDILKGTATNYARYCIQGRFIDAICSAGNRRAVIKFVRSGTAARNQLEASLDNGTPAAASVYNLLVSAVQGLQGTPVASSAFTGVKP